MYWREIWDIWWKWRGVFRGLQMSLQLLSKWSTTSLWGSTRHSWWLCTYVLISNNPTFWVMYARSKNLNVFHKCKLKSMCCTYTLVLQYVVNVECLYNPLHFIALDCLHYIALTSRNTMNNGAPSGFSWRLKIGHIWGIFKTEDLKIQILTFEDLKTVLFCHILPQICDA